MNQSIWSPKMALKVSSEVSSHWNMYLLQMYISANWCTQVCLKLLIVPSNQPYGIFELPETHACDICRHHPKLLRGSALTDACFNHLESRKWYSIAAQLLMHFVFSLTFLLPATYYPFCLLIWLCGVSYLTRLFSSVDFQHPKYATLTLDQ